MWTGGLWGRIGDLDTDLRGTFVGSYSAVFVGYRYLFVGMASRAGVASLEGESEFGTILSPRLRLVIPFGKWPVAFEPCASVRESDPHARHATPATVSSPRTLVRSPRRRPHSRQR